MIEDKTFCSHEDCEVTTCYRHPSTMQHPDWGHSISDFGGTSECVLAQDSHKREIVVGGVYRHFKGGRYVVKGVATHTETNTPYVVYANMDSGELWVRPCELFLSKVDRKKYPRAKQVHRFELEE